VGVSKNEFTEARRKFLVQNWRMVTPYLRDQLLHRSPEIARKLAVPLERLLERVQIREVNSRHGIAFWPKAPAGGNGRRGDDGSEACRMTFGRMAFEEG
jgi:hypothetical protein